MIDSTQSQIRDAIINWAEEEPNIHAVLLTGSFARDESATDKFSDLDIELYVSDSYALLDNSEWYEQFGKVAAFESLANDDEDWFPTRLVLYENGVKVDFLVAPISALDELVETKQLNGPQRRGYAILVDKDELASKLTSLESINKGIGLPTQKQYTECVNFFWMAIIPWAKYLLRQDLWLARLRERDAQDYLLQMIEWFHRAKYGQDFDTWYQGAHAKNWIDPEIYERSIQCFSLDQPKIALRICVELFNDLSDHTAALLHFEPFDSSLANKILDDWLS